MTDFSTALLSWFDQYGRKDLPWQQNRSAYRVWVSEIMLQQTQVKTVIPYFERFMQRFPGIDDLARASVDEVLHQWTGLGYYARARNLHKTAVLVMEKCNGELPMDPGELEQLPGIGKSTANAIVAQCAGQRAAILDGNVKRVLARYFAIAGWPGNTSVAKALWVKAELLTPDARIADYTQAIMDLGAMVCTRARPACDVCPVRRDCQAKLTSTIDQYPGKKPKKTLPVKETTMLLIEARGQVLLAQRPSGGIWGGLWSLPECESESINETLSALGIFEASQVRLPEFRHSFTHYHLDITPVHIRCDQTTSRVSETNGILWLDPSEPEEIGLSKPTVKLIASIAGQMN